MSTSLNRVTLLGAISKHGVELRQAESGAASASFQLVCDETTPEGKTFSTWLPVQVWGKRAPAVGDL